MESEAQLISFKVSHYCEKVRWAMDRLNVPYGEEFQMPPLHRLRTMRLGGSSVPMLVRDGQVLKDSAEILAYLDRLASPNSKLYPTEFAREIRDLEAMFDTKLGTAARQWAYFYILPDRSLMQKLWCAGVPSWQSWLFPVMFSYTQSLVNRGYQISAENAKTAYGQIQEIFADVSDRLSDGRKYLVGDRFSAADLTFACLAAPLVAPPEYGGILPDSSQLPKEMVSQMQVLKETIAGQYALRLYLEERLTASH
jgi:glutathione S-transferase